MLTKREKLYKKDEELAKLMLAYVDMEAEVFRLQALLDKHKIKY